MSYTVAIYGGTGFLGAEATLRILSHPQIEVAHVFAADFVGKPLSDALPVLEGKSDLRVEAVPKQAPAVDALMLALPHRVSHEVVRQALNGNARIIDMSGAFRVDSAEEYQRFYGEAHPLPDLLPQFVYGLPEVHRRRIQGSRFVASPGCFATCVELSLLPLARAGLLPSRVQAVGITGSSGAGAAPSPTTHHPTRSRNLRPYRPLQHPHAPEIQELLEHVSGRPVQVDFVPVAAPLTRGILVSSFATFEEGVVESQIHDAFEALCHSERFLIRPRQRLPEVVAVAGSQYAELGAQTRSEEAGLSASCMCALDNLVKGGAGQAVQNLNLMLGLDEAAGLEAPAQYP